MPHDFISARNEFVIADTKSILFYDNAVAIIIFAVLKGIIRYTFNHFPAAVLDKNDLRLRLMIAFEHLFFTAWALRVIVYVPLSNGSPSWFFDTIQCWLLPIFPFPEFLWYYRVKVGTHVEDLIYLGYKKIVGGEVHSGSGSGDQQANKRASKGDTAMDIHHLSTAFLCIGSYFSNYSKIGSLGKPLLI